MLVVRYEKEINGEINFLEIRKGASPDKEPSLYVQSNVFSHGLPMDWRLPVSLHNQPKIIELQQSIHAWILDNGYAEKYRQDIGEEP